MAEKDHSYTHNGIVDVAQDAERHADGKVTDDGRLEDACSDL